jgi:polyhydroxyalkanoate depolymerase
MGSDFATSVLRASFLFWARDSVAARTVSHHAFDGVFGHVECELARFDLYESLARGDVEKAKITKAFYDEYFAVLDLTAEFYLETVAWVFQEARLANRQLTFRGEPVEPGAIRHTALLTVEGERDDICALGQTAAAHDLCRSIKPYMRRHHMQAGVGHYGVFSGKRWEEQVYPIVRNMVLASE